MRRMKGREMEEDGLKTEEKEDKEEVLHWFTWLR